MLPQELEFIITMLAVFKAGKIAIPCSIPKRKNSVDRFLSILIDAGPRDIICSEIETSRILKKFNDLNFKGINSMNYEALY